jgi:hypothetical protein
VSALEAGDYVDMLVEVVTLPLNAERYYGPDTALRAALAADANTWKVVHREATGNRPTLQLPDGSEVRGLPLSVAVGAPRPVRFSLRGGLGWVPVRLTRLTAPNGVELFRETRTGRERVVQGESTRAFWQSDYDVATGRWSVTYNLPHAASPAAYVAVIREAAPTEPVVPTRTLLPVGR